MKKTLLLLVFALSLAVCAPCFAVESGWWWNPEESGRGVAIEIQDDMIFVAIYTYDATTGAPMWYSSGGYMQSATQYVGSLQMFTGGQCLGCNYYPPNAPTDMGQVVVDFLSDTTGQISYNGETIPIQRFDFSPCVGDRVITDFRNLCAETAFAYTSGEVVVVTGLFGPGPRIFTTIYANGETLIFYIGSALTKDFVKIEAFGFDPSVAAYTAQSGSCIEINGNQLRLTDANSESVNRLMATFNDAIASTSISKTVQRDDLAAALAAHRALAAELLAK